MDKKYFTDASLSTLINETKSYVDDAVSTKANSSHYHDDIYYTEEEIDNKIYDINTAINSKANSIHTHAIADVADLQTTLDGKVSSSRTVNGKALNSDIIIDASDVGLGNVNNTADINKPVSTAQQTAIDSSLNSAKEYTDGKIALLLNNSSEAVDSVMELADAMRNNADAIEALETIAAGKAAKATTLSGYGITDAYTKTEVDTAIENTKTFFVEVNKDSGVLVSNKSASEITQAFENGMTVVCLYRLNLGDVPSILQLFFCDGAAAIFGAVYGNYVITVTITGTNATTETIDNTVLHEHLVNTSNPHGVTKAQVGLGNVDNTSDMDKPVSNAQEEAINTVVNDIETAFEEVIGVMYNNGDDLDDGIPVPIRQIAKEEVDSFREEIMEVSGSGGDTLTWDGNMDGKTCVNVGAGVFCKVSNATPSIDDFANGGTMNTSDGAIESFSSADVVELEPDLIFVGVCFVVGEQAAGVYHEGLFFPETGIYLAHSTDSETGDISYVSSLTINGYTGFYGRKIKPELLGIFEESGNGAVVLPECQMVYDEEQGQFALTDYIPLEEGKTYIVNYNGVDYESVVLHHIGEDGVEVYALGNYGLIMGGADTGEPFFLMVSGYEMFKTTGVGAAGYPLDEATEMMIAIAEAGTQKIKEELLPEYESIYIGDDVVESTVPINADTLNGYTYEQIISLAGGLPVGSVILWDGDKVPTGWELVEEVTLD